MTRRWSWKENLVMRAKRATSTEFENRSKTSEASDFTVLKIATKTLVLKSNDQSEYHHSVWKSLQKVSLHYETSGVRKALVLWLTVKWDFFGRFSNSFRTIFDSIFYVIQGTSDTFLKQLSPEKLAAAAAKVGHPLTLRMQPLYDHSYFFISTFMRDHIDHHARALNCRPKLWK